ncbi:MAG: hypothetical protein K0U16_07725 [Gammaproteobacteria bacterium]|nr:hypothetical protein [Gammaproteobacteria bacterium]
MLRKLRKKIVDRTVAAFGGAAVGMLAHESFKELPAADKLDLIREFAPHFIALAADLIPWMRRSMPRCNDCGEYGHGYMLKNEVWAEALTDSERSGEGRMLLCMPCCANRLQRPITVEDLLPEAKINRPVYYAFTGGLEQPDEALVDWEPQETDA